MSDWKTFTPRIESFNNKENYEEYRKNCKCAICHNQLEIGDEFDLRPIQTPEETGSFTVIAVIVHKKCLEETKL